jgi:sugar phosphate isomerase/epimerase
MILAIKCAPEKELFSEAERAGLEAVELYLSKALLHDIPAVDRLCKSFRFRYAIHAPTDGSCLDETAELAVSIGSEIVVLHNIYWEDEWPDIIKKFRRTRARICLENTTSYQELVKFKKRFRLGTCLDLEHLQLENAGVYEDVFLAVIKKADHIHLTGYEHNSSLWHSHIHHSPEHGRYMLDLIKRTGYSGFVVSEARKSLQTYSEFSRLREFVFKPESGA